MTIHNAFNFPIFKMKFQIYFSSEKKQNNFNEK